MKKTILFAVKNPVTILMLVLAVLLSGVISFKRLGVDLFPNINSPKLYIEIDAGERPPEEIENLFVEEIESQAIRQRDVVEVSSVTQVGNAQITVVYSWDKDMDEAFLDLRKAMEMYTQNEDIDELTISQYDPNASPVMVVAFTNDSIQDLNEIRKVAENYIRNEIIRLEGIADVSLGGEETNEVVVQTSPYEMEAFGLKASDIASKIKEYNKNVSGGTIEEEGIKYNIKGLSMILSPKDLNDIVVGYREETPGEDETKEIPVFLHDVASVKVEKKEPETIVRLNGRQCIGLSIYKEPEYNTAKAVDQLNESFVTMAKALPGYKFTVVKDQGKFINAAINEVKESGILGIILAVVILLLFLKKINITFVISIAIPVSVVATFTLMYFRGLTLNIMTLSGLALGAGMLVDNAIIVMENIFRHLEKGKTAIQAAIDGTAEVGGAITASTLTTIVVFLPIVYMHGASGELFKEQAWTVAFSLLSSLFVAILVIPVLVTKVFPKEKTIKTDKTAGFNWYPEMLGKILQKRRAVIVSAGCLVFLAYFLLPVIGSEFMPQSASDNFSVEIKLREGSSLEKTANTMEQIESMTLSLLPDYITSLYSETGITSQSEGSGSIMRENTATLFVRLNQKGFKHYGKVLEAMSTMLESNPEIKYTFLQDETGLQSIMGTNEAPVVIEVSGKEPDVIEELTARVKNAALNHESLFNVESSIEDGAPGIEIEIDRIRAGIFNITADQVIEQLKNQLEGTDAGEYDEAGEMTDIVIRQPELSVRALENAILKAGEIKYHLTDVADISYQTLPRQILRRNQTRIGRISAYFDNSKPFNRIIQELEAQCRAIELPPRYKIQIGGEEEKRRNSMVNLRFALLLSVILVYMVMASQFESLIHPFTILLTIPLALVGTVFLFTLLGTPFNMMAYIGMIMLVGIAVNDSIILVDTINQLKSGGLRVKEAIIKAGHQRIRPIIMTSATTILALLPMTFGFGESAGLRSPMAWAVIGGLVTSTLLTLVVIPCVYLVFDGKQTTDS